MNLALPEYPTNDAVPTLGRCAELPRSLAGADSGAVELATASLAQQLKQLGWQEVSDTPGLRMYSNQGRMFALDQLVGMIAGGYVSAEHWEATCAADGISDLMVPVPSPANGQQSAPPPAGGYKDPFAVAGAGGGPPTYPAVQWSGGADSRSKRIVSAVGMTLVAILAIYFRVNGNSANDHLAGHIQSGYESEVAYDGKLSVDGGRATSVYVKQKHEFESVDNAPPDPDFPLARSLEKNGVSSYGGGGRNYVTVSHSNMRVNLDNPDALKQWINGHNVEASSLTQLVSAKRATMAGGTAWSWEYRCSDGCWYYAIRAPRGKHVYSVRCHLMASNYTPQAIARCKQIANNLKISGGRG